MLHAGVLMKLGAFGILRLGIQLLPRRRPFLDARPDRPGERQRPLRRHLGDGPDRLQVRHRLLVVSHMGFVLLGLATLNPSGSTAPRCRCSRHGVMTALMFSMVGAVYDQAHTRELAVFGGLASKMPRFAVVLHHRRVDVASAYRVLRLRRRVQHLRRHFPHLSAGRAGSAILGAGITAIYIFRLLALSFFGPFNEARWGGLKEMTKFEMAGGGLLIVFILFMGLWPAPFVDRISDTVVNHITTCRGSDEHGPELRLLPAHPRVHPRRTGRSPSSPSTC